MRICMFNNLFPPVKSGSSHFTLMLSRNLVARGHQVSVVTARLRPNSPSMPSSLRKSWMPNSVL